MARSLNVSTVAWALFILACPSRSAWAEPQDLCLQPYERGQELRHDGHLVSARDVLRTCTRETCPGPVRVDCVRWVAELDKAVPTLVIKAKDSAGRDVVGVHVVVDGQPALGFQEGRPFEIDPGAHDLVLTANGISVEEHIVVREAEKDRALFVTFASGVARRERPPPSVPFTEPFAASPAARPNERPSVRSASGGIPVPTVVFGGVALLGAAGFTYLWLDAVGDAKTLRDTCRPHCSTADVGPIETKAALADVSLGVGIAAAIVATGFLLFRPAGRGTSAAMR